MTLRSKITEIIKANAEPSLAAWKILIMLEEEGLGLFGNGYLDHDDDYEPGCNYFGITEMVGSQGGPAEAAISVLLKLEEIGLSLVGNGWLDDDEEALELLSLSDEDEGDGLGE